jgi:hypothetical protein
VNAGKAYPGEAKTGASESSGAHSGMCITLGASMTEEKITLAVIAVVVAFLIGVFRS